MVVRLKIWVEIASKVCGLRLVGNEFLVISFNEESPSFAVDMFCIASIVAEGGVFSPRIAFTGDRGVGLKIGVSLPKSLVLGVGVPERVGLRSGDLFSCSKLGVRGTLSKDRSGEPTPSATPLLCSFVL